ncbi:Thioesterase/thiol ester dehydrase-isomerase [Dacryopinax primogenitus]|uniref:Thioesterase/thiol ester dehydrase-isomerase n=1 Tax=Dacryopinax primogenitus (strain DJM 731) TaxID=1858805 RepID=M5GD72_DACPD|nr:Thioesterase/thiol ester dehydrase-isomerase [Dacryopinax primogenitus]EJU06640.1 Thioesterase/thiol ester dehydrase-isomerase [Dacryopinax primogenitus]
MTVTEDCLNGMGFLHGGCTAYLIDTCSSITLTALDPPDYSIPPTVSLNLNVTYHAAASLGASLRIISTVVSFSTRVQTVRCEVWDVTNPTHRLVASGMHIKMRSGKEGDPKAQEWRKEVYGEDMWATNAQKAKL